MNSERPILAIETSARLCGVSLQFSPEKYFSLHLLEERGHAKKLTGLINTALENYNLKPSDLEYVVVSGGPGSFTGLRIGFSAAKGFCLGAGIQLKKLNTLEVLAFEAIALVREDEFINILIKINKKELFYRKFQKKGILYKFACELKTIENEEAGQFVGQNELVVGNFPVAGRHFVFREFPLPEKLAELSRLKGSETTEDLDFIEPEYIKEFQITRKNQ